MKHVLLIISLVLAGTLYSFSQHRSIENINVVYEANAAPAQDGVITEASGCYYQYGKKLSMRALVRVLTSVQDAHIMSKVKLAGSTRKRARNLLLGGGFLTCTGIIGFVSGMGNAPSSRGESGSMDPVKSTFQCAFAGCYIVGLPMLALGVTVKNESMRHLRKAVDIYNARIYQGLTARSIQSRN